jgi:membrane protease YdiL (CAAX protease family)
MARWGIAIAYGLLTLVAGTLAMVWRWRSPFVHPEPWLQLDPVASHTYSALIGLAFGSLLVVLTPTMVTHLPWARKLHGDLRPIANAMSPGAVATLGPTSAIVEELLFRGLLQPWVGLLPQAAIFGLMHYIPGRSRWVWAVWAALVGLLFGAVFQLTGSLAGPILAHALINWLNLRYLRRHDPDQPKRPLGGLLDSSNAGPSWRDPSVG